jgi:DNA-binding PadR family transcriptional regulator
MTPEITRHQVFRPGELPLVLLALLANAPMNGYDLLAELGRLFGPGYKPSPGSVYPAIQALLGEKLIRSDKAARKAYEVTATGIAALERRAEMLAAIEVRTGARLRETGELQPVLDRFVARMQEHAGKVDPAAVEAVLERAAGQIESLNGSPGGRGDDSD